MKTRILALQLLAVLALAAAPALAQSAADSVKETGNDVKRSAKKGAHRVQEKLCTGTKAECAQKKLKHRATEAGDKIDDTATEVKDKVKQDTK